MTITSLNNDKVRLVRALQGRRRMRQREGLLVLEGVRLCEEAARAGVSPNFIFYTSEAARGNARIEALFTAWDAERVPLYEVDEQVIKACSDTETPAGLLAVVPIPQLNRPVEPTLTLILDRLRDPGNLGTILRTSLAAGVEQVLLAPGTVEATNPKVVRAGAGAHFRLPIESLGWDAIAQAVKGCYVALAAADGKLDHVEVDWRQRVALVVGGEATGAGQQARALAGARVSIPMAAGVESLNAAAATAVLLFEIARQRGFAYRSAPETP